MRSCLLVGYYGFGNRGDDLLNLLVARALANSPEKPRIFLLTGPKPCKESYAISGVELLHRSSSTINKKTLVAIFQSQHIIYTGGTLFTGYNTLSNLSWSAPAILARLLWKKRWFHGQGLGPFPYQIQQSITKIAFNKAEQIHLRDEVSAAWCKKLQLKAKSTFVSCDPVFSLHRKGRFIARNSGAGSKKIAVNLRPFLTDSIKAREVLERFLYWLYAEEGNTIYFYSMSAEDEKMAEDFINSQPELSRNRFRCINPQTDTDTMLTSLTSMDVAIGMRLHFNILAFLAGTPSLGLAYDPKVQALFQDFSLSEFSMPTHALDLDTMKSRILHLIEDRKSVSAYLLKECSKRANRAQSDLTQLVERITTS